MTAAMELPIRAHRRWRYDEAEGFDDSGRRRFPQPGYGRTKCPQFGKSRKLPDFQAKFDEVVLADELCDPQELISFNAHT